jgi:hypothetical protein
VIRVFTAILLGAVPAAPAMAGESGPPPLSAYVRHPPFEQIDGLAFLDHPAVRAAVGRAVRDPKVRHWLLVAGSSPSPPIFRKEGAIVSSGCQWHACDRRNWAILIDPAGKRARVCYFGGSGAGGRWYAGDGSSAIRSEDCRSGS